MMYKLAGKMSSLQRQQFKQLAEEAEWQDFIQDEPQQHWQKAAVTVPLIGFPDYVNAFFVKLPAKIGHLHLHADRDLQRPCPIESFNVVIENNDKCISGWYANDGGPMLSTVLEKGGIYLTDRDLMHESFNHGNTERIHLLVEMPRLAR